VDEGDRVCCDMGSVVMFMTGLCEGMVVRMSGISDGCTWLLKAEDVEGVFHGIVYDRGEVICVGDVVGAEA